MPYFFKLSDLAIELNKPLNLTNINNKWIEYVHSAVQDFSHGCEFVSEIKAEEFKDVVILFVELKNYEIKKHEHPLKDTALAGIDIYNFEYTTPNTVPATKILTSIRDLFSYEDADDETLTPALIEQFVLFFNEYLSTGKLNNIYIHITCNYLYDSILKNGLLGESKIPIRIGNRESTDPKINPRALKQKYLKYKQKYLKLKNLLNNK